MIKTMKSEPKSLSSLATFALLVALVLAYASLAPTLEQVMGWAK